MSRLRNRYAYSFARVLVLPWLALCPYAQGQLCPSIGEDPFKDSAPPGSSAPSSNDGMGASLAALGDVDGDGREEVVIGAPDDGGSGGGRFWVASINGPTNATPGALHSLQRYSLPTGVTLASDARFGAAAAHLGDLDGDTLEEFAIGAPGEDAVYLFEIDANLAVTFDVRVDDTSSGLGGVQSGDELGASVALLGDVDGDGHPNLAIGAPGCDDGGTDYGAVWIVSLDGQGEPDAATRISAHGGAANMTVDRRFGSALCKVDDFDLAVGAPGVAGVSSGSVWLLTLKSDRTVDTHDEISSSHAELGGQATDDDLWGSSLASGPPPSGSSCDVILAVGAPGTHIWEDGQGALWFLCIDSSTAAPTDALRVSSGKGGFAGFLDQDDAFGTALALPGDLDGDGMGELLVGAPGDDGTQTDSGEVWQISLGAEVNPRVVPFGCGGHPITLDTEDEPLLETTVDFDLTGSVSEPGGGTYLSINWSPQADAPLRLRLDRVRGQLPGELHRRRAAHRTDVVRQRADDHDQRAAERGPQLRGHLGLRAGRGAGLRRPGLPQQRAAVDRRTRAPALDGIGRRLQVTRAGSPGLGCTGEPAAWPSSTTSS